MVKVKNKKILLLAPKFFNYETEIVNVLIEKGANTDLVYSEPTRFFTTIVEIISRIGIDRNICYNYFRRKLKKQIKSKYDYIIIIDGWLIDRELAYYLKNNNLNLAGKIILYYWDTLKNNERDYSRWECFDSISTFDRYDYLAHKDQLKFLPLFYCDYFWNKSNVDKYYDLYVIGSFRLNRLEFVRHLMSNNINLNIGSHLYIPKWQFYLQKFFRKKYRNIKESELRFSRLSMSDVQMLYNRSKAIIDVPANNQSGLTIRTIEALAMHKKLITTNRDIVNYDFYNPRDIFVCDDIEHLTLPSANWFNTVYNIPDTIIKDYNIRCWVNKLLNI